MSSPSPDEPQLWRRILAGDGDAFGELFDIHRGRVFAHAERLTGARQDADDVTAMAFLGLWQRRRDVQLVNESVLPWLLVASTNNARNLARGRRRYQRFLSKLPRDLAAEDPAELLADGPLGMDSRLKLAMEELGDTDRLLLDLVVLQGYPLAEAAARAGLSASATKSRLHRIRVRIRGRLVADGFESAATSPGGSQ